MKDVTHDPADYLGALSDPVHLLHAERNRPGPARQWHR
jgi:hypothetical protein